MGNLEKSNFSIRERIAMRLLGIATWALPAKHPAVSAVYRAADAVQRAAEMRMLRGRGL